MKQAKAVTWIAALMLVVALAFSVGAPNGKAVPPPASPAARPATPERHPEIRDAIGALRRAKEHMEHAAHDFGGHKAEALRATDEAIHQLEICLKYDKD